MKNEDISVSISVSEDGSVSGITVEGALGAAAFSTAGAVGAAPFYAAGELLKGPASAASIATGATIETGFNIGAIATLKNQVSVADLPGVIVGSIAGGLAGPVAGIVAGVVADQTLGRLVALGVELSQLEDPDGGVNGTGQVSVNYGSTIVTVQTVEEINNGQGVTITVGYEFNALDQIAEEARHIGIEVQNPRNADYVLKSCSTPGCIQDANQQYSWQPRQCLDMSCFRAARLIASTAKKATGFRTHSDGAILGRSGAYRGGLRAYV